MDINRAHEMHLSGMTLQEIADHYGLTRSAVRDRLWRYRNKHNMPSPIQVSKKEEDGLNPLLRLHKALPATIEELEAKTGLTKRMIIAGLEELEVVGYNIISVDGEYRVSKVADPKENLHTAKWTGQRTITFGVLADTHMGSKYEQLTFLNELYDLFSQRGISFVYHAGDISEGDYAGRAGHIYERHKHGVDQQAEYIIEHYPYREGIKTYFIGGNHDATHMRNGGADILKMIARQRSDMINLGWDNAKVNLTPNCVIELNHPGMGSAYSLSYRLQKYIENISGGEKPNILIQGHHHKALYLFTRNIHGFEAGSIQAQSPWMRSKNLAAHVGGWIITVEVDESGSITRIIPEFIPLYVHRENDYK